MNEFELVTLASLLHDAGKFWQRTGQRHGSGFEAFDERDYGSHGAHAKWSADFIERHLPDDFRAAASAVLFHHRPRDYVTKLIAAADWMSSGEREETDVDAGAQISQLRSVFSRIRLDEAQPPPEDRYYPLEPLTLSERAIFPQAKVLGEGARRDAYAALWQGFVEELSRIPELSFDAYFETLYYLLQKYTWAIPAAFYRSVPDVSLFDHSRTTCAIATALYRGGTPEAGLDALLAVPEDGAAWHTKRLMLLAGDVTGVQSFLYTITARGAARGLRGRSFYLQLICEAVARWVLRRLELPLPNLLYSGGGRFYLVTHRLRESELTSLRRELDQVLLRCHQGELYLALGAIPVSGADLRAEHDEDVGSLWARLGRELNEQKRRKFGELPPAELHEGVFAPRGRGGAESGCVVCRREGPYDEDAPAEDRKCSLCASFEDLGVELRDAGYLYLGQVDEQLPAGPARSYADLPRALGSEVRLFDDPTAFRRRAAELDRGIVLSLAGTELLPLDSRRPGELLNEHLARGFYLLANVTPRKGYAIAEFADLAGAARGVRRLGILRLDVDDLGTIFGRGLHGYATLSRVASLSFLLQFYFEGWVARLAEQHNDATRTGGGEDHVYVIYSGGDDLFITGSWDRIVDLAQDIRRDFARFACENPALHLSAGIALEEAHFPLYQAAEHAGEALDRAKAREDRGRVVKDALDFLGQTVSWAHLDLAAEQAERLRALVEDGGVPRALIHTVGRIYRLYENERASTAKRKGRLDPAQVPYGRWMWASAYSLARLADRMKPPWRDRIRELQADLLRPEVIRTSGLAARWAELLLRKEEKR